MTVSASLRTLVIDSATEACSVALFDGDTLIGGEWRLLGRGHAESLVPMIAALPDRGYAGRIAVALGPGSFTGVRVGLAAARALAMAWGAQLVGYSTLDLVAAMARKQCGDVPVGVAMTGGHGEWFIEGFPAQQNQAHDPSHALASLQPQAAAQALSQSIIAGNQAQALVDARGHGQAVPLWPDAREFAQLAAASLREDTSPIYGRAPDARKQDGAA